MPANPIASLRCLAAASALAVPIFVLAADDVMETPAGAQAAVAADAAFVEKAAQGGLAEVALAKLAQQRSEDEEVDAFAARMEKDHGAANAELAQIAAAHNLEVPPAPAPEHEQLKKQLESLSGEAFDEAYGRAMVDEHAKTVTLFEAQVQQGQIAELRQFAEKTLPTLKTHHELAEDLPGAD